MKALILLLWCGVVYAAPPIWEHVIGPQGMFIYERQGHCQKDEHLAAIFDVRSKELWLACAKQQGPNVIVTDEDGDIFVIDKDGEVEKQKSL